MMSCRQATRLLSDAMERELSLMERLQLRAHTFICSACRDFGRQMRAMRDIARTYAKRNVD